MAIGLGINTVLGFAPETTYGTYVTPAKFLEITSEKVASKSTMMAKPSLRRQSADHFVQSKKSVEGSFNFQFTYDGAELLLKQALGSNSTTGSGPYAHTMSCASPPTGLSLYVNRDASNIGGTSAFKYFGCQISALTLTQKMEDFLECQVDVVGQDFANVGIATPTFPTFSGADYSQITTCTLGGATVNASEITVKLENNLATDRYKLGSRLRKGLGRAAPRKVSGTMKFEWEQLAEYNLYLAQTTAVALAITWTSSTYSLALTCPKVYVQGGDPQVSDAGPIQLALDWEAKISSTEGDELGLVLTNGVATIP